MRTTYITKEADIVRDWYVVDAEGHTLGRLASEIALRLRGKHKPIFAPNVDAGDYIVVINAEKIVTTGNKLDQKLYRKHSDYVGGLKETTLREMLEKKPEEVLKLAVKGMLPKNSLGKNMLKKLKVNVGPNHNNMAQKPQLLEIKY